MTILLSVSVLMVLPAHWLAAACAGLQSARWGHQQWPASVWSLPAWRSPRSGGGTTGRGRVKNSHQQRLEQSEEHICTHQRRDKRQKCRSPPPAAACWWMYSNGLSPPGGLCAPPASPSPPSAGTSRWRPAWRCPAGGAGSPGLEGRGVEEGGRRE